MSNPLTLKLSAKTPNFEAVIRSFEVDSVEAAILLGRKLRKEWEALGAIEIERTIWEGSKFLCEV